MLLRLLTSSASLFCAFSYCPRSRSDTALAFSSWILGSTVFRRFSKIYNIQVKSVVELTLKSLPILTSSSESKGEAIGSAKDYRDMVLLNKERLFRVLHTGSFRVLRHDFLPAWVQVGLTGILVRFPPVTYFHLRDFVEPISCSTPIISSF